MHRSTRNELHCSLADLPQPAADLVEQRTRAQADDLFNYIANAYGTGPKRWASRNGAARAVDRVALPYSLKQLSELLSCGGMTLGAPPLCACVATDGVLHRNAFADAWAQCVYAHTGQVDAIPKLHIGCSSAARYCLCNACYTAKCLCFKDNFLACSVSARLQNDLAADVSAITRC